MSEPASQAVAPPQGGAALSHRQILLVISGLMLGMLLAALDMTIMGVATKTIADELHGQTIQAWVTTAYLITSTISTPLYGKLSDIYGRKPMYMAAIGLFLIGSVLAGFSQSMYELAAFRAVQGLGAGGLMSLVLAIIADIVSPRERGRYMGYFMSVWGASSVIGPVVGGFFAGVDTFAGIAGWRWVFLVNIPVGIVGLIVVFRNLNLPHRKVDHRIDYWGAATLTAGLVPLLIVAEQGREWGWGSGAALTMYLIGAIGIAAFVFAESRMGDEALIPLRLFRFSVFSLSNVINFIMGLGMFGMMMSLPLYLQIVKGASPTEAGLLTLPMTAGILTAAMTSGRIIARTGRYKVFPVIGLGLVAAAMFLFGQIGTDTPLWWTMVIMTLAGGGLGLCMQTLVLSVQNVVPPKDMGVATSSATFFRSIGGTVGTAVFLSMLFTVVIDRLAGFARGGAGLDLNDTSFLNAMSPEQKRPILDAFSHGIDVVFTVGGVVILVAFALIWFLKEVPLSMKSGIERRNDEDGVVAEATPAAVN
ncbi:MAG TPA: MDR family MFS transporter [Actinophytocola sp.]|uniref:MDR family MFS transporter n=1 Tax=Actinophytocola sp. TaxID=1872138 RepID=UPI002DDD248C|nr:MDR family MFS transporter [Actinophytocola sp.]HEV2780644.1 MDR family MFS transporter [Actinophytocola sp.]